MIIFTICSGDASLGTRTCPTHIKTRTVLIWCSFDVYSQLTTSYSQEFSRGLPGPVPECVWFERVSGPLPEASSRRPGRSGVGTSSVRTRPIETLRIQLVYVGILVPITHNSAPRAALNPLTLSGVGGSVGQTSIMAAHSSRVMRHRQNDEQKTPCSHHTTPTFTPVLSHSQARGDAHSP